MIKNTELAYGSVAKWLHWLTALAFLLAYILYFYAHFFFEARSEPWRMAQTLHKAVGFSVLLFLVLRLYWRYTNPQPKLPDSMPWWQVKASKATHVLLYFFMFAMPMSGYLGNGGGVNYGIFRIDGFRRTDPGIWIMDKLDVTWEQWEAPFDYFHYHLAGPYILWVLIAIHAGAALYHHFVHKDDVLINMLPNAIGRRKDPSSETEKNTPSGE